MEKRINILYQSNDYYAMVTGTSMVSLLENNKHYESIQIYYLNSDISRQNLDNLKSIASRYKNCHLQFIDANPYTQKLKDIGVKPWRGIYVTWLKLLALGDLTVAGDRILFLNGQTIINGSLSELDNFDFKDAYMALSYDCLLNDHKDTIGLKDDDGYYNCGIMLINHKKWLVDDITSSIVQSLSLKNDYVIVDQDFCNVFFKGKIALLDSTYNYSSAYYAYDIKQLLSINKLNPTYFYTYDNLMSNFYAPKISHSLVGISGKPWELKSKHPQRYLWQKYIAMTPWSTDQLPTAKYNINWFLYDVLPSRLFMVVYRFGVRSKYGKKNRNKFIVMLFDKFTPQKGT